MKNRVRLLACILALLTFSVPVSGQEPILYDINRYSGPAGGDWFDTNNWSLGELPRYDPEVIIQAQVVNNMSVDINGPGAVADSLIIGGFEGSGALTMKNAGTLDVYAIVVGHDRKLGMLAVLEGSSMTVREQFHVGLLGHGYALINGVGSSINHIGHEARLGYEDSGYLEVSDRGLLSLSSGLRIGGNLAEETGTLLVNSGGVVATKYLEERYDTASVTFDGGTLRALENTTDFLRNFTSGHFNLGAGGGTIDTQNFHVTAASPIAGPGALTKTGTGELHLTGTNTYQGGTVIRQGTVKVSSDANLGQGNTVTLDGGVLALQAEHTLSKNIHIASGGGALSGTDGNLFFDLKATFTGTISGGPLTTTGGATIVLSGHSPSFSSPTYANSHKLVLGSNTALGTSHITLANNSILGITNGATVNNAVTMAGLGQLENVGGDVTYAGAMALNGDLTIFNQRQGVGNFTFSGNTTGTGKIQLGQSNTGKAILVSGSVNHQGTVVNWGETIISGVIGSNVTGVEQLFSGKLTLTGENTYTGDTTITDGTVQIGNGGTTGSVAGNIVNNDTLIFNRSDAVTFSKNISGAGTLVKAGAGRLTLTGLNTYTGSTNVTAGILALQQTTLAGAISVSEGAALTGEGEIEGNASIAGTLSAGDEEAGDLSFNADFTLESTAIVLAGIGGTSATLFDHISIEGDLTYGGTLSVEFLDGFLPEVGDSFQLFQDYLSQSGAFSSTQFSNPNFQGTFDYLTGTLHITAVPEPATGGLLMCALALFAASRRRAPSP